MAELRINPTRTELLKLKKRIKLAKRGHSLLKEKRDGLMSTFIGLIDSSKKKRAEVDEKLDKAFQHLVLTRSQMSKAELDSLFVVPPKPRGVSTSKRHIMNVTAPILHLEGAEQPYLRTYGFYGVPTEADVTFSSFHDLLPELVKLAETEKMIRLLAIEIEKTRRRVNSLEYVVIPRFTSSAKRIKMRLDEVERSNFSNLMRVKSIIEAKETTSQ